jgi:putative transposase
VAAQGIASQAYDISPHATGTRPASVLDLKADCRGYKYVEETIKLLPEKPAPILLAKILNRVAGLGRIHTAQPSFSFS